MEVRQRDEATEGAGSFIFVMSYKLIRKINLCAR